MQLQYRHEWKHTLNTADLFVLRSRLRAVMEADPHAVDGKYQIRSLYFDNLNDKALREKLDGVNAREKFRIRLYNCDPSVIHLEKKSKLNGLGTKASAKLTAEEAQAIVDGDLDWMLYSRQPLVQELYTLIAPYVEKDPTAFCSYEEFEAGVAALRLFCELRSESVRGQLNGTIPSTDEGQQADSTALVDASALTLSDMGSMGNGGPGGGSDSGFGPGGSGGGNPFGGDFAGRQSGQGFSFPGGGDTDGAPTFPSEGGGFPTQEDDTDRPSPPEGFSPGGMPELSFPQQSESAAISWPPLILSAVVLAGGLAIGLMYRRRR